MVEGSATVVMMVVRLASWVVMMKWSVAVKSECSVYCVVPLWVEKHLPQVVVVRYSVLK